MQKTLWLLFKSWFIGLLQRISSVTMLRSAVCLAGSAAAVLLRSSSRCDGKPTDRCDAGNRRCCVGGCATPKMIFVLVCAQEDNARYVSILGAVGGGARARERARVFRPVRAKQATNACAVAALAKEGFALIRCEDVSVLRSAFDESRRSDCVEASAGRFHYDLLRRRARDTALRSQIDGIVAPLRALAFEYCGRRDLYVSQLQLLDSAPGSAAQIWHLDNTRRGKATRERSKKSVRVALKVRERETEDAPPWISPIRSTWRSHSIRRASRGSPLEA